LFEDHADIVVKGGRVTRYGHKLNLVTGKSGLVLDLVIETGNRRTASASRHAGAAHRFPTARAPRQMAADGGYASG